mmetsp:Transcript_57472/g.132487  ORF Transcript_57472/g.132487 Transcript_57472/m.132487 type:complete len:145 (+) Transcript_57472:75-509(+)
MRCLLPVFLSFYLGSAEQCSAHNCDANTVQKAGVTEYTADAQATCCEASCSGYTCTTADHTLKADAASTAKGDDATAEATCCEARNSALVLRSIVVLFVDLSCHLIVVCEPCQLCLVPAILHWVRVHHLRALIDGGGGHDSPRD